MTAWAIKVFQGTPKTQDRVCLLMLMVCVSPRCSLDRLSELAEMRCFNKNPADIEQQRAEARIKC